MAAATDVLINSLRALASLMRHVEHYKFMSISLSAAGQMGVGSTKSAIICVTPIN